MTDAEQPNNMETNHHADDLVDAAAEQPNNMETNHHAEDLVDAAANGDTEAVLRLLNAKADIESTDAKGETGLYKAAQNGHVETLQCLLDARADMKAKGENSATGLNKAAANGHAEALECLLAARANMESRDTAGDTGLIHAAENGHAEALQRLLEARANVESTDNGGATAVINAATNGHAQVLQRLLTAKANIKAKDVDGCTGLEKAVQNMHTDSVRVLLRGGADPCAAVGRDNVELHILTIGESNVCGRDLLEACFRDVSLEKGEYGRKTYMLMGSARSSTEGPRPWHKVLRNEADLITFRHNLLDRLIGKHVTRNVPISHYRGKGDKGMLRQKLVNAMAKASIDSGIFSSHATHAILNAVWESRCRWVYLFFEYVPHLVMMVVAVWSAVDIRHRGETTALKTSIQTAILAKLILTEIVQLGSAERPLRLVGEEYPWYYHALNRAGGVARTLYINAQDYAFLVISVAGCWTVAFAEDFHEGGHEFELFIIAAWVFVLTMGVVVGLRVFTPFGPRMLPIVYSLNDTKEFIAITSTVLASFTVAFYVLDTIDAPTDGGVLVSSHAYTAFLHIFRIGILGDFELFELEGVDTTFVPDSEGTLEPVDPLPTSKRFAVHSIFFGTVAVVSVGLMNLLIGILGNTYDRYEERSTELFLSQRANIIASLGQLPWYRYLIWKDDWKKEEFYYTTRTDPGEDAVSMRTTMKQVQQNLEKNFGARLNAVEANLASELQSIAKTVSALEAKVKTFAI